MKEREAEEGMRMYKIFNDWTDDDKKNKENNQINRLAFTIISWTELNHGCIT